MDIPEHWEAITAELDKGMIMIIGGPDTGKTTFCQYLFQRLSDQHRSVAIIDGDPGQSRLGPPTTMTLSVGSDVRRVFVGSTSPVRHMLPMMVGAQRLVAEAKGAQAEIILYDTTGLIDETQGGVSFKQAKIDLLRPNFIIALQRGKELEPILAPFRKRGPYRIIDAKPSLAAQTRNMFMRRRYRRLQFSKYFEHSHRLVLDWTKFAVFPRPFFTVYGLVALEDRSGFTLVLGIVIDLRPPYREATLLLPKTDITQASAIRIGDIVVDPVSFEDQKIKSVEGRSPIAQSGPGP